MVTVSLYFILLVAQPSCSIKFVFKIQVFFFERSSLFLVLLRYPHVTTLYAEATSTPSLLIFSVFGKKKIPPPRCQVDSMVSELFLRSVIIQLAYSKRLVHKENFQKQDHAHFFFFFWSHPVMPAARLCFAITRSIYNFSLNSFSLVSVYT